MTSSSTSRTVGQLIKPEYRNWLALGHALTTVLCQGLRPFINLETETFYQNVTARLAAVAPCTCVYAPRRRLNQYHDMSTCAWANMLQGHHHANRPNWKQSDSTKWLDPNLGPWEIAKLFLPDLGGHAVITSAEDMDITGILNLMYWCNHFSIPRPLIKDVRDTRNNKWVHVPNLELTNADKKVAFVALENLLNDPNLAHDPDVQKALKEIGNLKSVSDLHSMEARVVDDLKEVIRKEISNINRELVNLTEESERNKAQQIQLKQQQETLKKALEDVIHGHREKDCLMHAMCSIVGHVFARNIKGIRKRNVTAWFMLLSLFWCFTVLDDSFNSYGCSIQGYGDPWKLKYFDFRDFINSSSAEFIGRQWLYREMERVLEHTGKRGVLITGNPGSGKSAFLSHLLCSTTSSPIIHNRILAYHFCMHFDKATQDGTKFVRNLANMIAWKITKYRETILTNSFVRRVLYIDCPQDPEWCFEQGILIPLKNLLPESSVQRYIVVDALDECSNGQADILNILKSKLRRLPKWLKLIVSSRNVSTITAGLGELQRVELRSDDKRNLMDIDTYLSFKVFSLRESIIQRIKAALGIMDNDTPTQTIVSRLAGKGQGNFMYVKVVLDLWLASTESVNWESFPKSLDSSYQLYFERKYGTPESFQSLRQIFEVLVAAYLPLTIHEMHSMLRLGQPTLDMEYEFLPKLDQISLFLWHGSGNGLIRIHHSSLSEWLTSEANKGKVHYVKKQNGHNLLAKYYLVNAEKYNSPLKPDEAFHLASHIVEGGSDKILIQQFLSLPSNHINTTDSETQTTALHYSSGSLNPGVTKLLVQHFYNVDCLDKEQRTPSFIAATAGHVGIVMVLFERGANLNHTVTYLEVDITSYPYNPVTECKRKKCGYSLLHTAAQEGNVDVVKFLIQHNVNVSGTTAANNTTIQLAAANGHLETVKTLKKAGGILDGLSLHHSAAGGHKDVVQYLLAEGLKDDCIHGTCSLMFLAQDGSGELKNVTKMYLYDNHYLYLRETALHAAVKKGRLPVIELLLSEDQNAINCSNSAGRRPQHEAVHANNYNALEVLLRSGANATVYCNSEMPSSMQFEPFILENLPQFPCPCGYSPLHLTARNGFQSIAKLLIKYKANVNAGDCNGSTPLHVASCQGNSEFVVLLVNSGADINATSLNGSTPLHSAATCFAKGVFGSLLDLDCNPVATDSEGMTPLHYVLKDVDVVGFEYLADLYVSKPKNWIGNLLGTFHRETMKKLDDKYPWLSAFIDLIKSFATNEKARKTTFLTMQDKSNRTVFDQLEEKTNISFLLTGSNELRIGETTLAASFTPVAFVKDVFLSEILNGFELAIIPKSFERVIWKIVLTVFATDINCSSLVKCVNRNFVHSVNFLLQAGMDVNCFDDASGLSPLLIYLRTGGRHMSKVLVRHKVEVKITCGDPFETSAFHLLSYHKLHYMHYLYDFLMGSDNWQKYLQTENAIFDYFLDTYEDKNNSGIIETIRTGDGPLASAIMSHPNGTKVIDKCFDAEGFNALHRAAQGANLVAVQKFLSWGANISLETEDGFSRLWLSILHAVKYRPFLNLESPSVLTALEVEMASFSALAILSRLLQNGTFDVGCNESRSDLTLYHVAATRGMWQFIAHLLSSEGIIGIDVNCRNKDGITPMYLAKFTGGDSCEGNSPWCKVVDVIQSHGGTLQYPTMAAEYFLVFNIFFGKSPSSLFLELTDEEILGLQENCGREECQKYKNIYADLVKTSEEVDRVRTDYQKKVDKCSRFIEECPAHIRTKLPHFSLLVSILDKQLRVKFQFFDIRNSFINFLDKENERLEKLLYAVTRPLADSSVFVLHCDDMLKFLKEVFETKLHALYRRYRKSLHLVKEKWDKAKSSLAKMKVALHRFDTTLDCDWQSIAIKYVQLSFKVRNLNFWCQAATETSTEPSASDFLLERMKNILSFSSEESRKLALKLASRKSWVKTLNYLKILRFTKPPFWRETFIM